MPKPPAQWTPEEALHAKELLKTGTPEIQDYVRPLLMEYDRISGSGVRNTEPLSDPQEAKARLFPVEIWGDEDRKRAHQAAVVEGDPEASRLLQQYDALTQERKFLRDLPMSYDAPGLSGGLSRLRRILPTSFGGQVEPYYDPQTPEELGLDPRAYPPGADLTPLIQHEKDKRWAQALEEAKRQGRGITRVERSREEQEKINKAEEDRRHVQEAAFMKSLTGAFIPGGDSMARWYTQNAVPLSAEDKAKSLEYQDRAESEGSPAVKMGGAIAGGLMPGPTNAITSAVVGRIPGIRGLAGYGPIGGAAKGAAQGAVGGIVGGGLDDAVSAAADPNAPTSAEYLRDMPGMMGLRGLTGALFGAVPGAASGYSKSLRGDHSLGRALRDFEAAGGSTSVTGPGGLKPSEDMAHVIADTGPFEGLPSDRMAEHMKKPMARTVDRYINRELSQQRGDTEAYYRKGESSEGYDSPLEPLVKGGIDLLKRRSYSLHEQSGDLAGHENDPIRNLIRKSTEDVMVADDAAAQKLAAEHGGIIMTLEDAKRLRLLDSQQMAKIESQAASLDKQSAMDADAVVAETGFRAAAADDVTAAPKGPARSPAPIQNQYSVVFVPKTVTPRELDQMSSEFDFRAGNVGGGTPHPIYKEMSAFLREARDKLPGLPGVTPAGGMVYRDAQGKDVTVRGYSALKKSQELRQQEIQNELARLGINQKELSDFDYRDARTQDAIGGRIRNYAADDTQAMTPVLEKLAEYDKGMSQKVGLDNLRTVRGLRLMEGRLSNEPDGPKSIVRGLGTGASTKFRADPIARGLSGKLGGLTGGAAPEANDAVLQYILERQAAQERAEREGRR